MVLGARAPAGCVEILKPRQRTEGGLGLHEGGPESQLPAKQQTALLIYSYLFSPALPALLNFPFIFSKFFRFIVVFCFIN
jgi:hypothetical protein